MQQATGFAVEDVYAYAVSELLTKPNPKVARWRALVHRAWLLATVLFTFVLQLGLLATVFSGAFQAVKVASLEAVCTSAEAGKTSSGAKKAVCGGSNRAINTLYAHHHLTSIAVSFALVVLALCVHKKMVRAAALARAVMSHTNCMPAFFAALLAHQATSLSVFGRHRSWFTAACLLLLPVLQLLSSLFALVAGQLAHASLAFDKEAEESSMVSVVFNSVALLFVLDLDTVVYTIVKAAHTQCTTQVSGGNVYSGDGKTNGNAGSPANDV